MSATIDSSEYAEMMANQKTNKYGNKKIEEDGYRFDSLAEHRRYRELKLLMRSGAIGGLEVHPRWNLVVNGEKICSYIPDFRYCIPLDNGDAREVLEDVKGAKTAVYNLKKKLIKACYGIEIVEVTA